MTAMGSSSRRWRDLSPARRTAVMSVAAVDLGLRTWALVDLKRRPTQNVRGPKAAWAAGLAMVSSAGLLPLVYLVFGRRRA
jgi:hypothetical protein